MNNQTNLFYTIFIKILHIFGSQLSFIALNLKARLYFIFNRQKW